jgi:rubredoxin
MVNTNDVPSIHSAAIASRVVAAFAAGADWIRVTYTRNCPVCGAEGMIQDGVLSTGRPLEHYTPEVGEVLKNHWMECRACGFDQAS